MHAALEDRECGVCGSPQPFEVPPCADGHDDCPERVCTRCSTALVVGPERRGRLELVTAARSGPAAAHRAVG